MPLTWGGVHHGGCELARLMTLGSLDKILRILGSVQTAIVAASLGGAFGSGAICVLAALLKHMGIRVNAVVQIPFEFEFRRLINWAKESLETLNALLGSPVVVDPMKMFRTNRATMSLKTAFTLLDREIARRLERCLQ
ncbi:MAG: hypothetical protein QXQ53_06625 [Candidatus Methanosuratincola sp.]